MRKLLGLDDDGADAGRIPLRARKQPGADFPDWAKRTLRAPGSAERPDGANSSVQAMMLARHTARDRALRTLASLLGTLSSPRGELLSDMLRAKPDLAVELEALIREGVVYEEERSLDDREMVAVALPLYDVALLLFGEDLRQPVDETTTAALEARGAAVSTEAARRIAIDNALKAARERLMSELEKRPLREGGPMIGEAVRQDPELAPMLRVLVESAETREVRFPEDRVCEVTLALSLPAAQAWLSRRPSPTLP
jgi:hypothetical protein